MSEESRLGREAIETAYALKQLVTAGVRVFFYLEDRERTLDSPTDKIMLSLTAFADELEREKARQRTYDAMLRKARAGHVTGGRVFGYDNVEVLGPTGKRSHVRTPDQRDRGRGRAPDLRALGRRNRVHQDCEATERRGRTVATAAAGAPRGVGAHVGKGILDRRLYLGEVVWNQTRKRNAWGQHRASARPESEWLHQRVPELQVISEAEWNAAHGRLQGIREQLQRVNGGRLGRHARDVESATCSPASPAAPAVVRSTR